MKRKDKIAVSLLVALAVVACSTLASAGSGQGIYVNGKRAAFSDQAFEQNGRLLVPLRAFGERLGADVMWDAASETVTLLRAPFEVRMTVDSADAVKNGRPLVLDAAPQLVDGSVYIPLRSAANCLGAQVDYDPEAESALVSFEVKRGNTNGNSINGGYAAEDEAYIYVSSYYQGVTWKIDKNTQERTPVIRCSASGMNVVDGWIYAWLSAKTPIGSQGLGLCKFRPDGSGLTRVTDLNLHHIGIVNNKIYAIHSGYGVCTMNLDGSGYRLISEYGFDNLNVSDSWLVVNDNLIRRMDPDTGAFVPISGDAPFAQQTILDGEYVYYANSRWDGKKTDSGLYRCSLDGSGEQKILDMHIKTFNVRDGYLYFTTYGMENGIWKSTVEGKDITKIHDRDTYYINVIGDELFCTGLDYAPQEILRMKTDGSDVSYISLEENK